MANLTFCFPDYSMATYYPVSLSSDSSWNAKLPLNNLKSPVRQKVARTISVANQASKFIMDLGTVRKIQMVAVLNHNFSLDATIKFTFANYSGMYPQVYQTPELDVFPAQGNYPTAEVLDLYKPDFYHVLPTAVDVNARYILVEIFDETNAATYLELGRLFVAPFFSIEYNADYGLSFGWTDPNTTKETALNGTDWFSAKRTRREIQFTLSALSDDEAFVHISEMIRRTGTYGEMYLLYNHEDTDYYLRMRSFLCRFKQMDPLSTLSFGLNSADMSLVEVL